MEPKHRLHAIRPTDAPESVAQASMADMVRHLAVAISELAAANLELARREWPIDSAEAASRLKCKVDTLRRIPVQQLPRYKTGKEVTYLPHEILQYMVTYSRVQPRPENLLATPRRRRPSFDSDGGRGRDSLKGKAS